nr:DUF2142 domain-containing protein [uncultured Agathobaculum sp.]
MGTYSKKFNFCKKRVILCLFIIVSVYILYLLTSFGLYHIQSVFSSEKLSSEDIHADEPIGEIVSGTQVIQSIPIKTNIAKIQLLCATYARENAGTLQIQVIGVQSGIKYADLSIDIPEIKDNSYVSIPLEELATRDKDSLVNVQITSDSVSGSAITIWRSSQDVVSDASLTLNGVQVQGDLVYSVTPPYWNLSRIVTFIIIALIVAIICKDSIFQKSTLNESWTLYFKASSLEFAIKALILYVLFALYLNIAKNLPIDLAPDEYMRDDIPYWIYNHNSLPIGTEPELLNNAWGFSYAFMPYLPSIIAYVFMKIISIFTSSSESLQLAMRMVSVISGCGCVYFGFKLGSYFFQRKWSAYFLGLTIGALPQISFLSGYLNNDIFSLLTCLSILYFLVSGHKEHWPVQKCIALAVSIAACMLTYYFAYGWILVSIVFCIGSCLYDKTIENKYKFILSRTLLVATIIFVFAGWYFIRNAIIYNGDFLGINASRECAAAYAAAGHDVYVPVPPKQQGINLFSMFAPWIVTSFNSLLGLFGYMDIPMQPYMYYYYYVIIFVGILAYLISIAKLRKEILLNICLVCTILIPILFSLYQSYAMGYQPQGRYIIAALPAIMIFMVRGYEYLFSYIHQHFQCYNNEVAHSSCNYSQSNIEVAGPIFLSIIWICAFIHVYLTTINNHLL